LIDVEVQHAAMMKSEEVGNIIETIQWINRSVYLLNYSLLIQLTLE